jgi:YesN/AraC family two-component response regulator
MTVELDSLTRLKNKILIVDDHPFIIQGYKTLPGTNQISMSFAIMEAKDCESAYHVIVNPETPAFDIAF